jgi:SAM-dependent methyltransferase
MRDIVEQLTPNDRTALDWHRAKVVNWFDHVLELTRAAKHPTCKKEWLDNTSDEVVAELGASTVEIEAIHIVGKNMLPFLRGETTLLEPLRRNNHLTRFYKKTTPSEMASVAEQVVFRYPRMKILEVGAGTGTATGAILDRIDRSYHSYTYTDISPGFFEDARNLFKDHSDRFIYKVLDIEKSPKEQGFVEHSYDMIVAANVLHATRSLQETTARVRTLLKPGGYLLLMEGTNTDVLHTGFIFSGLKGWWFGEKEGRVWGPMQTAGTWDRMLKAVGFSGVDTITPDHDKGLRPFSILLSQAVDAKIRLLRQPYTSACAVPRHGDLFIIGGATCATSALVIKLEEILTHVFRRIVRSQTLESLELHNLTSMATVLNLADLDRSCFKDINERQLEALKSLVNASQKLLWVTAGSEAENPYQSMSKGFLACMGYENPYSQFQHLNIIDLDAEKVSTIATALLRMADADFDNDYGLSDCVWTTEPELRLENGVMKISRMKNDPSMNKRYMSNRRSIHAHANLQRSNIRVMKSGDTHELFIETRKPEQDASWTRVQVSYSTSTALKVEGAGFLHLVIGLEEKTQVPVLALSEHHISVVSTPSHWCWALPKHVPETRGEAVYLGGIATALLAVNLVSLASPNTAILVHEADDALRSAISAHASATGIRPYFSTSKREQHHHKGSTIFLHEMSSTRVLADLLPADVSVAARCDQGSSNHVFGRLESLLPSIVRRERLDRASSLVVTHCDIQKAAVSFNTARELAHGSTMQGPTINTVYIQELPGSSANIDHGIQIVDWTRADEVPVKVQPASSHVIFSAHKTYLLVGMTGDIGRSVCQWMITRGARHVVLTSRNPKVEQWWTERMERLGAKVVSMSM